MSVLNKKINLVNFIFITFLFFISCENKETRVSDNLITFSKFSLNKNINFKNIFEFKNGVPAKLHLIDSTMIIYEPRASDGFFFYNYSLKHNTIFDRYLRKGRGSGEAIGAMSSGIIGNTLWLHDISLKKILTTNLQDAISTVDKTFREISVKQSYHMIEFKDSSKYFATGDLSSILKIKEINLNSGEEVNDFGKFMNLNVNDKYSQATKMAYDSFIYRKPSGGKIALSYRFTDVVEIFDVDLRKSIAALQGPDIFEVNYNPLVLENGLVVMERTDETRFAFVSGTVTDNFIYLLYSGKYDRDINPNYGKYVYVYDWNGKEIQKLTLDREILCLTVSQNDKNLYAYDPSTGYIIKANIN